jgi:hypothetical protein
VTVLQHDCKFPPCCRLPHGSVTLEGSKSWSVKMSGLTDDMQHDLKAFFFLLSVV